MTFSNIVQLLNNKAGVILCLLPTKLPELYCSDQGQVFVSSLKTVNEAELINQTQLK